MDVVENRFDLGHVGRSRDLVHLEIRIDHVPEVPIHVALFEQGVADALDDAAEDLAFGGRAVDDEAAILQGDDLVHLDDAEVTIDGDLCELHAGNAALVGGVATEVALALTDRGDVALADEPAGVLEREGLLRILGVTHGPALEHEIAGLALQVRGGEGEELLAGEER